MSGATFKWIAHFMVSVALLPLFCRTWSTEGNTNKVSSELSPEITTIICIGTSLFFSFEQLSNLLLLPPFECWPVHKQADLILSFLYCFGTLWSIDKVCSFYVDFCLFSRQISLRVILFTSSTTTWTA